MAGIKERTLILIKPDGIQRALIGRVIQRFEDKGFKLIAMKMVWATEDLVRRHYEELSERPFFESLVKYMVSGPTIAMIWQGLNVAANARTVLGSHTVFTSGTIRGDFCSQNGRNVAHGSHDSEAAEVEIKLWFNEDEKNEIFEYTSASENWIYG